MTPEELVNMKRLQLELLTGMVKSPGKVRHEIFFLSFHNIHLYYHLHCHYCHHIIILWNSSLGCSKVLGKWETLLFPINKISSKMMLKISHYVCAHSSSLEQWYATIVLLTNIKNIKPDGCLTGLDMVTNCSNRFIRKPSQKPF